MLKKSFILPFILVLIVSLVFAYVNYTGKSDRQSSSKVLVAITQIAPHPSLDKIREGIVAKLKAYGLEDSQIVFQNAQGSPATALQVAQKFVSMKPSVIVPITTPSAQAAVSATKTSTIPVIFSAVSDPISAKLADPHRPSSTIAGISDLSPAEKQVDLIETLLGKNAKIGILYNAGEANSVALVRLFESACQAKNITLVKAIASNTNDVAGAATSLLSKEINAIFIPNDNTVISAFESVLRVANVHKIPVFTGDPESVERGALASIAFDQYEIGLDTGNMVVDFLKGEKIVDLGVKMPSKIVTSLNKNVADSLGILIPDELLKNVRMITQKN